MSDYISRKALIDTIEKNCYPIRYDRCSEENGMTVTGIMQAINEQPAAFDLESVINKTEEVREEILNDTTYDNDIVNYYLQYVDSIIEIMESAANATNGKNGG